jgi:hypothetical protein
MNSDTQITDPETIPCPTPGCERPTYEQMHRMFARNDHLRTERFMAALRAPTHSGRAIAAFGKPITEQTT